MMLMVLALAIALTYAIGDKYFANIISIAPFT